MSSKRWLWWLKFQCSFSFHLKEKNTSFSSNCFPEVSMTAKHQIYDGAGALLQGQGGVQLDEHFLI